MRCPGFGAAAGGRLLCLCCAGMIWVGCFFVVYVLLFDVGGVLGFGCFVFVLGRFS